MNNYFIKPMRFDDFGFMTQYFFNIVRENGNLGSVNSQIILKVICTNDVDNREAIELKNKNIDETEKIKFSFFLENGYQKAQKLCADLDVDFDLMCREIKCVQYDNSDFKTYWVQNEMNEKDFIINAIKTSVFRDFTFKNRIFRDYINDNSDVIENDIFSCFKILGEEEIKFDFKNYKSFGSKMITITGVNGSKKSKFLSRIKDHYIGNNDTTKILNFKVSDESSIPNKVLFFQFGLFDKNKDNSKKEKTMSDFSFHINKCDIKDALELYTLIEVDNMKMSLLRKYMNLFFISDSEIDPTEENLLELYNFSSTGQKYVLLYLVSLLINIERNSLILIDELEVSQHPQNIFNLINFTNECLDFYQSHAIIVTHSPYIVQSTPKYLTLLIEDNIARKVNFETLGTTYDEIVERIFNVPIAEKPYIELLKKNKNENPRYFEKACNNSNNKFLFMMLTGDIDV